MIFLPGSKTTIADLDYLKERAFDAAIHDHRERERTRRPLWWFSNVRVGGDRSP
ncbi:MAG: hypothetical protein MRJ99_03140 [Nitrospirales bacterium]|nr:hypothetical protein [Nitrospirales bacterium]